MLSRALGATILTRAASHVEPSATLTVIEIALDGRGVPRDSVRAASLYQDGCKRNDGESCLALARIYSHSSPPDERRAKQRLANACKLNLAEACSELGDIGRRMLAEACQHTRYAACTILGYFFDVGMAGVKDPRQAVRYYLLACDSGERVACTNLGLSLLTGRGVKKDLSRA